MHHLTEAVVHEKLLALTGSISAAIGKEHVRAIEAVEELIEIDDLKYTSIPWPRSCVQLHKKGQKPKPTRKTKGKIPILSKESGSSKPSLLDDKSIRAPSPFQRKLYNKLMMHPSSSDMISYGMNQLFALDTLHQFSMDEMIDILEPGRWLSVSMLHAWCKCLYDRWIDQLGDNDVMRFLFLDPASCSSTQCKKNNLDAIDYVSRFFYGVIDSSDIIFLSYIEEHHWYLYVIQLSSKVAFEIDPFNKQKNKLEIYPVLNEYTTTKCRLKHLHMRGSHCDASYVISNVIVGGADI